MPRCKYCGTQVPNGRKLRNQHEPNCERKVKIEDWQKRVAESEDKTFWYVDTDVLALKACILSNHHQMIKFFINGELDKWSQSVCEKDLFSSESEAQTRLDYLKNLYLGTFKYKPYIREEMLVDHLEELKYIENAITERLEGFPNFTGIDFCNVGAHGIQIRGHHQQIKGYTYGSQPTIKYDFSNYLDTVDEFVAMWEKNDIPERIRRELSMITEGEKYGWD